MTQTPWWGVPLLAGLFAIGGVVVSQVVTIALDRVKARREDARRWHAERRQVYVGYIMELQRTGQQFYIHREDKEKADELSEPFNELMFKAEEVILIASDDVRAIVGNLNKWFIGISRLHEEGDLEAEVFGYYHEQIAAFRDAVRRELQIK
ncbi:hypothetical protein AB0J68_31620 [Micromonospora sp. NPDC049580]|uniref:hypothetical protein n=1 Tax=Micromonospora sp. NPDC049580 TaxID=3154832 RepID=UPI00343A3792